VLVVLVLVVAPVQPFVSLLRTLDTSSFPFVAPQSRLFFHSFVSPHSFASFLNPYSPPLCGLVRLQFPIQGLEASDFLWRLLWYSVFDLRADTFVALWLGRRPMAQNLHQNNRQEAVGLLGGNLLLLHPFLTLKVRVDDGGNRRVSYSHSWNWRASSKFEKKEAEQRNCASE
jgi:hypothetical protein